MNSVSKFNLFTSALLLAGLTACGPMNSSDPARNYSDVPLAKPHNAQARTQEFDGSAFSLTTQNKSGEIIPLTALEFFLGEPGAYKIQARTYAPGAVIGLALQNEPKDLVAPKLTEYPGEPNTWLLSWTPPRELLPPGSQKGKVFKFQVAIILLPASTPQALDVLKNATKTVEAVATVRHSTQEPAIVGVTATIGGKQVDLENAEVNVGDQIDLTIRVQDPSSYAGNPPTLATRENDSTNTEQFKGNGNSMIVRDPSRKEEQTKDDEWSFHWKLFVSEQRIPVVLDRNGNAVEKSETVPVRLNFGATGVNGMKSPDRSVDLKINTQHPPAPPVIKPSLTMASITASAGAATELTFEVGTKSSRARININEEAMKNVYASWPGKAQLTCGEQQEATNTKTCKFTWQIPCNDPAIKDTYVLPFEASVTSGLNGKTSKSATLSKPFKIVKNSASCPKPPPAPKPAAPAPAKPAQAQAPVEKKAPVPTTAAPAPSEETDKPVATQSEPPEKQPTQTSLPRPVPRPKDAPKKTATGGQK